MSLYRELKRRNVFRVAIAYLAGSWLLVEVAETIFPLYGFGDTPARAVVTVLAIGFPLFLLFSWVFEITPEGLKRETEIDRAASITHRTGKQLDRIIIILLALALGYFAFDKFVLEPARVSDLVEETAQQARSDALVESYGDKSIAVLPFVNMSADPEQEYFSDGISEELLNLLARIPELRVISRSSAFSFKGKDIAMPTVAEQLNVAHVLEGSVRKVGNRVRITAQLIEARSDSHLWSESYDRELDDIFAIQDEISTAIIRALKKPLGLQSESVPSVITAANTEAHDAYLRGRHMVTQRTKATIEGAVREFEEAITFDPDYALAHAELAMAIRLLQNDAYGDLTTLEVESIGLPHAERALVLDPNLAEAHVAMGAFQETREERLAHYEQAIRINPNYSYVHVAMSGMLNALGRYEEMFSASEKAVRLDPLSFPAIRVYVYALILRNRLDDASRELDKISSIYPALYAWMSGLLNSVGGNRANFIFGLLDALMIDPESVLVRNFLTFRFASIGLEQEALEISDVTWPYVFNILGRPRDAVAKTEALLAVDPAKDFYRNSLAHALAAVGEYARARPILEESWERNERRVTHNSFVFSYGEAMALIAIRRDAGDEAGARELLEAIRKDVGNRRKAGIIRAEIHESVDFEEGIFAFLIGEREKGLALISKGVEDGFFIPPNEAYLQTLYDDPGFAPILADQEARQARERNRFLAIVCTDNPYEEVWQPAEGTCEQFAAEGGN